VHGEKPRSDAVTREELSRYARVFRRDDVDRREDVERAQGDVTQISERRSDHI
jgi:hypothetical protein